MFLVGGCSGDDNPTTPADKEPPPSDQLPAIPVMTDPDAEPPVRSEAISLIKPARDYAPMIKAALTDLRIWSRGRYEEWPTWIDCWGIWQSEYTGTAWTNGGIPPITGCINACGLILPFCSYDWGYPPEGFDANLTRWPRNHERFVFFRDGARVSPEQVVFTADETFYCKKVQLPSLDCISKVYVQFRYFAEPQPLAGEPYLRRDRLWVAQKWESGALVHQIAGENETRMKTLWMSGCEKTQIETFAWSVGAEVGATVEALSAAISASISKTFSTEVTVSEATETSVEKVLVGKAGKLTCHMYWALVDRYSFVNADGTRFEAPNYVFDEGCHDPALDTYYDFEIVGVIAERVVTYEFDITTGAFLGVTEHPAE
jgi:hypothetical protein